MTEAEAKQVVQEIQTLFPQAGVKATNSLLTTSSDLWMVCVRETDAKPLWDQHFFVLNSSYDWTKLKKQLEVLGVLLTPGEECYVFPIMPEEQGMALLDAEL